MTRLLAACCLAICVARPTCAQERSPDGRIYGELLPFAGLNGVRVQLVGMLPGAIGAIYNIPGGPISLDPAKDVTGLGRPELAELHREIVEDIADAFRRRGSMIGQGAAHVRRRISCERMIGGFARSDRRTREGSRRCRHRGGGAGLAGRRVGRTCVRLRWAGGRSGRPGRRAIGCSIRAPAGVVGPAQGSSVEPAVDP